MKNKSESGGMSLLEKVALTLGAAVIIGSSSYAYIKMDEYVVRKTCQKYGALKDYPRELQEGYLKQDQPNPWYGPRNDVWELGIRLQADDLKRCD